MIKKNLVIPNSIEKKLKRLPKRIRGKFWDSLETLFESPDYPALRHKRIQGTKNDWEFSVTMNYRVTYIIDGDDLIITNVGKHEDVF